MNARLAKEDEQAIRTIFYTRSNLSLVKADMLGTAGIIACLGRGPLPISHMERSPGLHQQQGGVFGGGVGE